MRKLLSTLFGLLLLTPVAAAAQVELGMDAGLEVAKPSEGDTWIHLTVPAPLVRIGFPRERMTFETLLAFQAIHYRDTDAYLALTPGVNLPIGDDGQYFRGEALLTFVSEGNDDFGLGAAFGIKRRIRESPASVRFEVGFNRMFDAEVNRLRLLVGLSTAIGG